MSLIFDLVLIPALLFCGVILHELTHYLTIYPIAQDVRLLFDNGLYVEYDIQNTQFKRIWANLSDISPSIVGMSTLIYLLLSNAIPTLSLSTIGLYLGVITYSVGGPDDYSNFVK